MFSIILFHRSCCPVDCFCVRIWCEKRLQTNDCFDCAPSQCLIAVAIFNTGGTGDHLHPSHFSPPQTATNLLPVVLPATPPTLQQISHISPPVVQPGTSTGCSQVNDFHAAMSGDLPLMMSSNQLRNYSLFKHVVH